MFPRSVSTTRRIHARVHTQKDWCLYTFLTYEVMPMRNFKHITPCLSHPTGAVETKYNIITFFKLTNPSHYATFDLQRRLRVQIVTYEDVSVCNVSQNF